MPTDEDWWPSWLRWWREPIAFHCAVGAAFEWSPRARPEKTEQLNPIFQLPQPLLEGLPWDASCLVIVPASPCTQPQQESSTRHHVQRRRHFRQHSRVPVRMREDQRDCKETTGRHCQHRESSPTFQTRSCQQVVQASAVVAQAISCLPDGQQVLIRHVSLVDTDNKMDGLFGCPTAERNSHRHAPHDDCWYTSG